MQGDYSWTIQQVIALTWAVTSNFCSSHLWANISQLRCCGVHLQHPLIEAIQRGPEYQNHSFSPLPNVVGDHPLEANREP